MLEQIQATEDLRNQKKAHFWDDLPETKLLMSQKSNKENFHEKIYAT